MNKPIEQVLTALERVQADLDGLTELIWRQVDYRDRAARQAGADLLTQYEDKLAAFRQAGGELAAVLRALPPASPAASGGPAPLATRSRPPVFALPPRAAGPVALTSGVAHGLDEEFTGTHPTAVAFLNQLSEVRTWRDLYLTVCRQVAARDPECFATLPDRPEFTSRTGNPAFTRGPRGLRAAAEVVPGIYAEVNLSANGVRDYIWRLLTELDISAKQCRIYLRGEDRPGSSGPI